MTESSKQEFGDLFHRHKQIESYHVEIETKESLKSASIKSQNFPKLLQIAVKNYLKFIERKAHRKNYRAHRYFFKIKR